MVKIVHATSKGQITLPKSWREKSPSEYFEISVQNDALIIRPLQKQKTLKEEIESSWKEHLREETIDHDALKRKYGL